MTGRKTPCSRLHAGVLAGAVCLSGLFLAAPAQEQGSGMLQPRRLIDAHTAGVLPKGYYDFEFRIYPTGDRAMNGAGLLTGIYVGITDRFSFGLSYGGDGLIGRGRQVNPDPFPGGTLKYRIFDENYFLPAVAIGYEHQGYGGIEPNVDFNGYIYKSQGFFAALSKNYLLFNAVQFGLHGAVDFSLEDIDIIHWPNGYVGMDLGINNELAIAGEYNLALNELDEPDTTCSCYVNPLKGILNLGIRWAFTEQFYIEFDAKDVLERKVVEASDGTRHILGWSRELKLVYVNHF
jgi:hypothetical protein